MQNGQVLTENGEEQILCTSLLAPVKYKLQELGELYCVRWKKGLVKHLRKINRTFAYWSAKGILIGMFIKKMIRRALAVFDKQVGSNTEIVRSGRSSPRKKKPPRLYPMSYKDL